MKTAVMKLDEIIPAEYNPRVQLKPGDTEYEALQKSIEKFGLVEPLIVNGKNNVLIGGHQRLNVLKEMGVEETEVVVVDLDEQQEKTLNVALNKIEGDWDYAKLEAVIKDLNEEDYEFTGFSEDEIENIIGISKEIEDDVNEVIHSVDAPKEEEPDDDTEPEFEIYLSFPTKEEAENWLKAHDIDREFDGSRALTIRMEE